MGKLADISAVIQDCRERIATHDLSEPVRIGPSLWAQIRDAYLLRSPQSTAELVGGHTIKITTPSAKKLFVSAQELPQIWGTIPYARAVLEYEKTLDKLATEKLGFAHRGSGEAEAIFKKLPSPDWQTALPADVVDAIREFLEGEFEDEADRERFETFLASKGKQGWSGIAKELSRGDWLTSAIPFVGEWLAVGAAERGELVLALAEDPAIEQGLEESISTVVDTQQHDAAGEDVPRITGGDNELFYGAPGTGKSYNVWQSIDKEADPHFVTVFHPDMQNSDFAGTLKPGINDEGEVSYAFRPGPFARAVAKAWAEPDARVYLVIEELNRAVAAAVFGELFQVLDRESDGGSSYEVDFPSPEFANWFAAETGMPHKRLSLPSNLWIYATMNSADQGVYPLDTAFRRRWRQNYLPIEYTKAPQTEFVLETGSGGQTVDWRSFVEPLNGFLVENLQVDEDRLVGPFFVDERDLETGTLPGKLLIYLWDDLLRHHTDKTLFHPSIRTYGDLHKRVTGKKQVFSDGFLASFAGVGAESDEEAGQA